MTRKFYANRILLTLGRIEANAMKEKERAQKFIRKDYWDGYPHCLDLVISEIRQANHELQILFRVDANTPKEEVISILNRYAGLLQEEGIQYQSDAADDTESYAFGMREAYMRFSNEFYSAISGFQREDPFYVENLNP
jgi:hypothetical protein